MQVGVKLPAEPLVDYLDFCRSIAQVLRPIDETDIEGIDCITGKIVTHHVPMEPSTQAGWWPNEAALQSVLISEDGRTLDQLRVDTMPDAASETSGLNFARAARVQVVELSMPHELTDDDRRALEKLLPELPALRHPISDEQAAAFMGAFFRLQDRPAWEPTLISARTIEQRRNEQDAVMQRHLQALQEEFANGRLVSVDSRHVPTARLAAGCYIPRDQAIAYLTRVGLNYCDQDSAGQEESPPDLGLQANPDSSIVPAESKGAVGKRKLTAEQRKAVVKRHRELDCAGVHNPSVQTAAEFGISDRYVRKLVEVAEEEAAAAREAQKAAAEAERAGRIDHLLVSGEK
ncbi:hypothetical protein [Burkholderia glumae]|uniref:hypothetical protein n=1 Tax=Burkholderia glumae TaxID=337 RepID=UPI00148EE4EB|nr:hypothetical protein [Burkholderia glumae]QJW78731.1 hypothetical protein GAS18_08170 [Burkholderia glumae]